MTGPDMPDADLAEGLEDAIEEARADLSNLHDRQSNAHAGGTLKKADRCLERAQEELGVFRDLANERENNADNRTEEDSG